MAAQHRSKTVCLLGGTGFVGRTLSARLVSAGYAVRIPTRNRQRSRHLLVLPGVDLVMADVHDPATLRSLFSGVDAVINLVGIANERGHDGSGFKKAHVELAQKVVQACQDAGVNRLIQMSALKANADHGPSHYLRTKGKAEQAIAELSGEQTQFTIFRPSLIFGPEDSFLNRFARLLKMSPVLPMPQLSARFTPVHVDDVAAAVLEALTNAHTHGNTYELCGPDIYSLREILNLLKRELRIKRLVIGLPMPLARIQAWVADYLIPGKPFSLDNLRSMSVSSICSENGFSALGIEPKHLHTFASAYLAPAQDTLAKLRHSAQR